MDLTYKTTKHTLKFATDAKKRKLGDFIHLYRDDLQKYITLLQQGKLEFDEDGLSSSKLPIYNINDSRWRQIIYRHACRILSEEIKKFQTKPIDISTFNIDIFIDERMYDKYVTMTSHFNEFISIFIESPETKKIEPVKVPIKYHSLYNKYNRDRNYILKKTIKLMRDNDGELYILKYFEAVDSYIDNNQNKHEKKSKREQLAEIAKENIIKYLNDHEDELRKSVIESQERERKRIEERNKKSLPIKDRPGFNSKCEYDPYKSFKQLGLTEIAKETKNLADKLTYTAARYYADTNGISFSKAKKIFDRALVQAKSVSDFAKTVCGYIDIGHLWLQPFFEKLNCKYHVLYSDFC